MIKKLNENRKYLYIISFFIFLEILVTIKNFIIKDYILFLWICDLIPILLILAFSLKNDQFIKSIINVALIPQFLFVLDVIIYFFFKISIFGFAPAFFDNGPVYVFLSLMIHLFSANVAFYFTYKEKPKLISIVYSFFLLILLWLITLYFSFYKGDINTILSNINYVYDEGQFFGLKIPYYTDIWVFLGLIFVVLPTYILQYLMYKYSKK